MYSICVRKVLKYFMSNGCLSLWYNTSFAPLRGYGIKNLAFSCNLRVNIDGNGHSVTHRWQTNAIGSTSICLICINKFETVHIQWLLVGTVHHPNHYHDSVYTKIWHFVCKLRVDFDKDNGTVIPTSGSEMLSEASFIYLMYQRKVWNTSITMVVSPYSISSYLSYWEGDLKILHFVCSLTLMLVEMTWCDP